MEKRGGRSEKNIFSRKISWVVIFLILIVIAYITYAKKIISVNPANDIIQIMKKQGYTPNAGFSGIYQPGNIIQLIEKGPDGKERKLSKPVVFLWGSDCFPGKSPVRSLFTLPETTGTSSGSLILGAEAAEKLLPSLVLNSSAVADYTIKLENPQVLTYARGDISAHFSDKCLDAFSQELNTGDKIEWFSVIQEVVAADSLRIELKWKLDSSAEAQNEAKKQVENTITSTMDQSNSKRPSLTINTRLSTTDSKTSIIEAKGLAIIGYSTRPLYTIRKQK